MSRSHALLRTALLTGSALGADAFATDWPQWGFDPAHSANNTAETGVSAANVTQLEQKYAVALTGRVNAAPVFAQGITTGCGGGKFCPTNAVNRQQMAVFLLKTLEGSSYDPPACANPTFTDVPCSNPFSKWIYELVDRGITAGCGGGLYCPLTNANRGQMATFVVKTFSLQ